MAYDLKGMKKELEKSRASKARFSGEAKQRFKPKPGDNYLRVLGFPHKVTDSDIEAGDYEEETFGKTLMRVFKQITRHFTVAKFPVRSHPALMAEYQRLKASPDVRDQARALEIRPSFAFLVNVVDVGDATNANAVLVWSAPRSVQNYIAEILDNEEEYGGPDELLGCKGRDFIVSYDPKASPQKMYTVSLRDKKRSKTLPSDVQDKAVDFFDPANEYLAGDEFKPEMLLEGQPALPAPTRTEVLEKQPSSSNGKKKTKTAKK